MKKTFNNRIRQAIILVLSIGLLFQVNILINEYLPVLKILRADMGKSAIWRGAAFSHSNKLADYMVFLNQNIPLDAKVILPPYSTGPVQITKPPYMQYFLFPREIHNCTKQEEVCAGNFIDTDWYSVITNPTLYPTKSDSSQLVLFDDNWGVYKPDDFPENKEYSNISVYSSFREIIISFIAPIIFLLGITFFGYCFINFINSTLSPLIKLGLGFGVGVGIFSFVNYLLLLNNLFSPISAIIISVILFLFFLGWLLSKNELPKDGIQLLNSFKNPWIFLFGFMGLVVMIISVGKGYQHSDEIIIWASKGYGISIFGLSEGASKYGTLTTHYPLNIPILISTFKNLFSEKLPESKIIFSSYYLFLLISIFSILKEKVSDLLSGLITLTVGTMPLLFLHGTRSYANLPSAYYLVSAILLISYAIRFQLKNNLWIAGLLLALAAWTRPEILLLAWLGIFATVIFYGKKLTLKQKLSFTKPLIVPLLGYSFLWSVTKPLVYMKAGFTEGYITTALQNILSGNIYWDGLQYLINYSIESLLSIEYWGLSFWIVGVGIIILALLKLIQNVDLYIISMGLVFIVLIMGSYFLTSYSDGYDLSWWLTSGFDRMIFPGAILLYLSIADFIPKKETKL